MLIMLDTLNINNCLILAGFSMGVFTVVMRRAGVNLYVIKRVSQTIMGGQGVKLVLVARTDLGMGKGKLASQCAHAALSCYKESLVKSPNVLRTWEIIGQPKIVLRVDREEDLLQLVEQAKYLKLVTCVIQDAGRTQVRRGSITVVGIGPGEAEYVDQVTRHLKLL